MQNLSIMHNIKTKHIIIIHIVIISKNRHSHNQCILDIIIIIRYHSHRQYKLDIVIIIINIK